MQATSPGSKKHKDDVKTFIDETSVIEEEKVHADGTDTQSYKYGTLKPRKERNCFLTSNNSENPQSTYDARVNF